MRTISIAIGSDAVEIRELTLGECEKYLAIAEDKGATPVLLIRKQAEILAGIMDMPLDHIVATYSPGVICSLVGKAFAFSYEPFDPLSQSGKVDSP